MRIALLAMVLLVGGAPAVFADSALLRLGTHSGFGRVVFEFAQPVLFTMERAGSTVTLHFPEGGMIPSGAGEAKNVVSVTGGPDTASVTVAPGSRLRTITLGNRVVMDVFDPALPKHMPPHPAPAVPTSIRHGPDQNHPPIERTPAASLAPIVPVQPAASTPVDQPRPPASVPHEDPPLPRLVPAAASPVTPQQPAAHDSPAPETLAIAAVRAATPPGTNGSAVVLPFGPNVAAAAFQHGDEAWIVFDERRPLDLASLPDDRAFAGASVQLLPAATLLKVKSAPGRMVRLGRQPDGWSVLVTDGSGQKPTMMPVARPLRLLLPVASPGQVVAVPDPETGRNLLVGPLRSAGPGVPVPLRVPEFTIVSSWQGVVIDPVSDRTTLRAVPEGFAIETGSALSVTPDNSAALASAAVLTRRFDFPAGSVSSLMRRLQTQVQEVGQFPAQSRLEPRKAVAQTMLSLGLGAEAQSLLRLAAADDPRAAADPDWAGLSAIAALLSGRPQEADGLDAPGLAGSDEIALWHAVRAATTRENAAEAASVFATTAGLIAAYPSALQNRLLPLAAEAMVTGGATQAADALLASVPDEPLLTFARAIRLEQKGESESALTLYDALSKGRDRLASARAATRATLLRLSSGSMSPAEAATSLERGFGAWRGDARERDLRLRTAEIEGQAGHWRKAIDILRETAQLFPDDGPLIAARITSLLGDLLHSPAATAEIAPMELVSLAEENAAAVAQADAGGMAVLLADKLAALDLPKRAGPIVERMAAAAPAGVDRATLGARLAALRLSDGDAAGAAAALATTDAPALPAPLQEERGLLDARIHASARDISGAAALLSAIGSVAADELRATLLSESGDWHGAALALASVAMRQIPDTGPLDPAQQDLVLRLASAQSRAGDEPALHDVAVKQASRMSGARADMFRLLTTAPVTGVGDLRRVAGDIALARALPSALNTVGTR